MSDIRIDCPGCGRHLIVDSSYAGTLISCSWCPKKIQVPGQSTPQELSSASVSCQSSIAKHRFLIARYVIALCLLGIFATGIIAWTRTHGEMILDGEVFVVTNGGQSIRLGLVPVKVFSIAEVDSFFRQKHHVAMREIAKISPRMDQAKAEYQRLSEVAKKASKTEDPDIFAEIDADHALSKCRELEEEKERYTSVDFYMRDLPASPKSTKTDADGRFSLSVPRGSPSALVAFASRNTGLSVEQYYWLLYINPKDGKPRKMMLCNDNLLVEPPGPPFTNWNEY